MARPGAEGALPSGALPGSEAAGGEVAGGELALANLLRLRGDAEGARQALGRVLARDPHDAGALDLMARLHEDEGDAEGAARWRVLARDSARPPDSAPSGGRRRRRALAAVAVVLAATIALALLIVLASVNSGGRSLRSRFAPAVATESAPPELLTGVAEALPPSLDPKRSDPKGTEPAATGLPTSSALEESALARLKEGADASSRALALEHDPRAAALTVTLAVASGESPRAAAALMARRVFATFRSPRTLTLRVLRARDLVYMAGSTRERYAVVDTDEWRAAHPGSEPGDALADALLADEWTREGAAAP